MIHKCKIFKEHLSVYPDKVVKEPYIFTQRTGRVGKYQLYQHYHIVRPHWSKYSVGSRMIRIFYCPWCGKPLKSTTPIQQKFIENHNKHLLEIMKKR